uniref:Uncharacterized protein n=1 Tax=Oryza sativa subsp. japonica TaxID=39947 RepID=Q33B12_ORYSJ|nr:hypothetical protein LOC_Os10g06080 [Oryza sativa Japonica Group]
MGCLQRWEKHYRCQFSLVLAIPAPIMPTYMCPFSSEISESYSEGIRMLSYRVGSVVFKFYLETKMICGINRHPREVQGTES